MSEFPRRIAGSFFKVKAHTERRGKGVTARARAAKRRKKQQAATPVYAEVDARDGLKSRLTGIWWGDLIHRHHMDGRGVPETVENTISLGPDEHLVGIHGRGGQKWLRLAGNANVIGGVEVLVKVNGTWERRENI